MMKERKASSLLATASAAVHLFQPRPSFDNELYKDSLELGNFCFVECHGFSSTSQIPPCTMNSDLRHVSAEKLDTVCIEIPNVLGL